jgi:hypothetical protein
MIDYERNRELEEKIKKNINPKWYGKTEKDLDKFKIYDEIFLPDFDPVNECETLLFRIRRHNRVTRWFDPEGKLLKTIDLEK